MSNRQSRKSSKLSAEEHAARKWHLEQKREHAHADTRRGPTFQKARTWKERCERWWKGLWS